MGGARGSQVSINLSPPQGGGTVGDGGRGSPRAYCVSGTCPGADSDDPDESI